MQIKFCRGSLLKNIIFRETDPLKVAEGDGGDSLPAEVQEALVRLREEARHSLAVKKNRYEYRYVLCKQQTNQDNMVRCSVADPDPYVFGPSGSFFHQAKKVRKSTGPRIWICIKMSRIRNTYSIIHVPVK